MYQNKKEGLGKGLLLGFLIGGIAGAITGLLLAPKTGRELRSDIQRKSDEIKDGAKKIFTDTSSKIRGFGKTAYERGEELYDTAGEIISDTMEQTSKFSDAVKAGYGAYKEERDRA
ncbi:MAG: YtxH domain-containing protein [Ignavibacteria bacterium]|nr:YtxH domain-containing protein [Ignavibacteria bacterium]